MFKVDLGERVELNGFTRHGIERLSPSQINKFIECPSAYVAQYLLGHRFPSGAPAYRGRAVETGLHRALYGDDLSACIRVAEKQFQEELAEEAGPTTIEEDVARDKEFDAIPDMVTLAADELADFGMPDGKNDAPQRQVIANAKFDTYSIPIMGYVDFTFSDFDLVVDLKTTFPPALGDARKPCPPADHLRRSHGPDGQVPVCDAEKDDLAVRRGF